MVFLAVVPLHYDKEHQYITLMGTKHSDIDKTIPLEVKKKFQVFTGKITKNYFIGNILIFLPKSAKKCRGSLWPVPKWWGR